MARNQPQINIRISPGLREELTIAAANSGRSLTAEVVARLEQSFKVDAKGLKIFDVAEEMGEKLTEVVAELEGLKVEQRLLRESLAVNSASGSAKPRNRKR